MISLCPNFCLSCLSQNICSVCYSGYAKNANGQCLPCVSNCRLCADNNQGLCLSCGDGFYLNSQGNCIACTPYCTVCYSQGCMACAPGYYISPNSTCIPICLPPCASCQLNSTSICTSCLLGYTYNPTTNSCTPQTTNCTNGSCYYCPINYANINNICTQCSSEFCARCNPSDLSSCLTCINGYYLSAGSCVLCPRNCASCTSNVTCSSCLNGYTLIL